MLDIDKTLEEFHKANKPINDDLSSEENLVNIFNELDDANKEKLLTYASDLYYSHKYQTEINRIPILNLNLED